MSTTPTPATPEGGAFSLTRPATPAQLAAVAAPLAGAISIRLDAIEPSPFNPRKHFEGIDDLAASIEAQGLLENLVVRRAPAGSRKDYQLVAGERRFRALKQLKHESASCRVIEADDAQARAAQIVENLQRADISPAEEAEAFARLQDEDPKTWTAAAIGRAVGKTDRFVSQRLTIARGLAAPLKKQFAAGELKVEIARTVAALPATMQSAIAKDRWALNDAEQAKRWIAERVVPVEAAAFDVAQYKGEIVEDNGKRFFADAKAFGQLQAAAAEARVAELRAIWPTAKLVKADDLSDWRWADNKERLSPYVSSAGRVNGGKAGKSDIPREKQTAIVWIERRHAIRTAEGVIPAASYKEKGTSYGPPRESADARRRRLAHVAALRDAIAGNADFALRLTIAALAIGRARLGYDHQARKHTLPRLPATLQKIEAAPHSESRAADAMAEAMKLDRKAIEAALAAYASEIVDWSTHEKKPGGFAAVVGERLKVALPPIVKASAAKAKAKAKAPAKAKAKAKTKAKAKAKTKAKGKAKP